MVACTIYQYNCIIKTLMTGFHVTYQKFFNMHFCVKYFFTSVAQSVIWLSITSGVLNYLTWFYMPNTFFINFLLLKRRHSNKEMWNWVTTFKYTYIYLVSRTSFHTHTTSSPLKQTFAVHVYITGSTEIDHTYYITVTLQLNT